MSFFCAISGTVPKEPVVSTKSGHVYEKSLIVKYIVDNGAEPLTGEKLEEADLVSVKANPNAAPPRPQTLTSVPALLQALQNEWDALVLETFTLKQQYNSTRQELSHALYAQDAATRVVARLMKERDAAREALASVQASMGGAISASANDVDMVDAGESAGALPAEIVARIDETHAVLSTGRKKRQVPSTYADSDLVKNYRAKHTIPSLHSPSPAGITSLALSSTSQSLFLTGGNDKVVQLYDRASDKVVASLKGHTKKITHVALQELAEQPRLVISGSADKTVRVWAHDSASDDYAPKTVIRVHKGEISGLVVHPTSTLLTVSSLDKTYSIHDLTTMVSVFQSPIADEAYTSLAIHPDGALVALGTPNSTLHIFDIRTGALAATLEPEEAANAPFIVGTSSFSEKGYHLAAPDSVGTVAIWDLRKQKRATSIGLGEGAKVNKVLYDTSAQYLGVAASTGLKVFAYKTWEDLVSFEEGGEVTDLGFGVDGKEIWGAAGREIRIWGEA